MYILKYVMHPHAEIYTHCIEQQKCMVMQCFNIMTMSAKCVQPRSLSKRNKCFDCVKALLSSDDNAHEFLNFIDRGKLTRPSKSAVSVCLESEKVLQRLLKGSGESLPRTYGIHDTVAFYARQLIKNTLIVYNTNILL